MVDGKYALQIDTPLGKKPGLVVLKTQGDVLNIEIDVPILGKQKAKGRVTGNAFEADGAFRMGLMGKVSYALRGEVSGNDLSVQIKSSKGDLNFNGKRM